LYALGPDWLTQGAHQAQQVPTVHTEQGRMEKQVWVKHMSDTVDWLDALSVSTHRQGWLPALLPLIRPYAATDKA
jgi:hypothetical protein